MKKFKKTVLIALAVAALLASCGKSEKKSQLTDPINESKKIAENELQGEDKKTSQDTDDTTDTSDTPNSSDTKAESKNDNAKVSDNVTPDEGMEYSEGVLTENSYESKFVGVKFKLPSNCKMMTKAEIDDINSQIRQSDDESQKYMHYEANIASPDDNIQVIVCVDGNKGNFSDLDYLANVAEQYRSAGAEVDSDAYVTEIGKKEYLTISSSSNGGKVCYSVRKSGEYMITFISVFPEGSENKIEKLLSEFKKY